MNATVAQLTARSLLGRRRALWLLLLPLVLLAMSIAGRQLVGVDLGLAVNILGVFALGTLVPLLGLIVGTGAIGPEIDDGSIIYLLSKPVSRARIVVSKYAVAVAIVVAVAAIPTFIAGLLLADSGTGLALGYAAGAAVAGIGYSALFLLLAVVTRNAVVLGLVYALVWESLIGQFVPGARSLSVQQWALAITERLVDDPAQLGVVSSVELPTAIVLLTVVTVGGVVLAARRLRSLRITSDE